MRYAVISDIHGNLEAFRAVLEALSKDSIDEYVCVGDIVGYGANPKECIDRLKGLGCRANVAGNHEWGVLGVFDLASLTDYAGEAVLWTRGVLGAAETEYLKTLPLLYEGPEFTVVHGSLESPEEFNYILNRADAAVTAELMKTPLCFVGHTHVAGVHYFDKDKWVYTTGPKIKIDPDKRYVINAGSVGQPRDGDPRACYAVYDDASGIIEIKRASYDVAAAGKKILNAGLPAVLAARLSEGR